MSTADWIVLGAGIAAIAWVNWYFFLAGRAAAGKLRGEPSRKSEDKQP